MKNIHGKSTKSVRQRHPLFKWLYRILILLIILAIFNFIILPGLLGPFLRDQIRVKSPELLGVQIQVDEVSFSSIVPFHVALKKIKASKEGFTLSIQTVQLSATPRLSSFRLSWGVDLRIIKPKLQWSVLSEFTGSDEATQEKSNSSTTSQLPNWLTDFMELPAEIRIEDGDFKVFYDLIHQVQVKNFNFQFLTDTLLGESAAQLNLRSKVSVKYSDDFSVELPLRLDSSSLRWSFDSFADENLQMSLAGLDMKVKGQSQLKNSKHQWRIDLNLPDLASLPVPAQFLPPGDWRGGVRGMVRLAQEGDASVEMDAQFKTHDLSGNVQFQRDDLTVKGPLNIDLDGSLSLRNGNLMAPQIQANINADKLSLAKAKVFRKQAGEIFNFEMEGYVTKNVLVLKQMRTQLAQLVLGAKGFVGLQSGLRTELDIVLPSTRLQGLEKNIPVLGVQPAKGSLSVQASVKGDLFKGIEGLSVVANPVKLSGFSSNLNYRDDQQKNYLIGPVTADLQAVVRTQGNQVGKTTVQGDVDMSRVEIVFGQLFKKTSNEKLLIQLRLGNQGENLSTSGSSIFLGKGSAQVSGSIAGFKDPRMKLNLALNQLPVHQVLQMTGFYRQYPVDGIATGNVKVAGQWISRRGVEGSPLVIDAQLNTALSRVKMVKTLTAQSQDAPAIEAPLLQEVPALLPNWPVFQKLSLRWDATVSQLQWDQLRVQGVSSKVRLASGQLTSSANVSKIFGGQLSLSALQMPLLKVNPRVAVKASVRQMQMAELLAFAKPDFAKEVNGRFDAQLDVSSELPGSVRFMSTARGLASLQSTSLQIRSLKLDQVINDMLKKIPQVKVSAVKTEGFSGAAEVIAAFQQSQIKMNRVDLKSVKGDQLDLSGLVDLNGKLDLQGELRLQRPPLGGDIYRCNKDSAGRFVLPLFVKGFWNQPSFDLAKGTVEALVKKTLLCQFQGEKQNAESQLKQEVKKRSQKIEEDLKNKAKDKLKELFK